MTSTSPDLDTGAAVLMFARDARLASERAEADLLHAAVTWAVQHPPESIGLEATWPGTENELTLAGSGAPTVSEFCVAEFAAAIGRSTDSGRVLLAVAVELKYRLPKTQRRLDTAGEPGGLSPWRARRIAEATLGLTQEAAAFVDAQVAPFAHSIGPAQLDRLIEEAIARFMPDQALENAENAADGRHFTFDHQQVSFNGTTRVEAELDLGDALDLDAAIIRKAEELKACGSVDSLDVRRSIAAGEIARHQLALDLAGAAATDSGSSSERSAETTQKTRSPKPRQVVLYVHLSQAAITGTSGSLELARVENQRQVLTADQVRTWCANPDTQVTVKPVIDLDEHIHVDAYEVPERLQEQTEVRDSTCIFPWCQRPAWKCDSEHCVPHTQGGTTCSCNIGPLCRRHHRLKTHSPWSYTTLEPGSFLWTSPHGYQFFRDHHGSRDVTPERPPPRPDNPPHF